MSARSYLAWNMLEAAAYEDERREQGNFQAGMRKILGNLLEHNNNNNFIKEYRLSKEAFEELCDLLRNYTVLKSTQRVSLEAKIQEVTTALNHPNILKRFINFPTTRQERDTIKQRLLLCDSDCLILSVNAKFGGSTHDSFIWENSNVNNYMQSLHRHNEIVWLLGDSGYPQRPWLMTPYLDPAQNSIEDNFNMIHSSARVVIENTFGRLKNRWRCVHRDRTLHYQPDKCAKIIIACCVLHNIALKYNLADPVDESDAGEHQGQEPLEQHEVVAEHEGGSDLLMGRALRNLLARRLARR